MRSSTEDSGFRTFKRAFETRDVREFMSLIFPPKWESIAARITETGVSMCNVPCQWAARWSPVPPTIRHGATMYETYVKSCIYRAHDCIHQLWGLPRPDDDLNDDSFRVFKRANMCGEIAVLTITEFALCRSLYERFDDLHQCLLKRNALQMLFGPLAGKSLQQIASRLDGLLHKRVIPDWARDHAASSAFCADYQPMLQRDREMVDANWRLMQTTGWRPPAEMPDARYDTTLDGLELTLWMVDDFHHLMSTGKGVDSALAQFNAHRRCHGLPDRWGGFEPPCADVTPTSILDGAAGESSLGADDHNKRSLMAVINRYVSTLGGGRRGLLYVPHTIKRDERGLHIGYVGCSTVSFDGNEDADVRPLIAPLIAVATRSINALKHVGDRVP